ncbi:uncharacterized protein DSM5745_05342 [Aspergillus mulundensis]|uniref:Suppressor protein SRP40 n=1 Tax=Aspergillus mulundensis TaxID=1810919 RepID=A0A3D8S645_9EURO|nr:Uncharacterized protein DSM5745_05342 [Aspergillus mulundensis]RDW81785.1 Uncharacterized protein DSM5745_05342 [Aspergillus mulundensis]
MEADKIKKKLNGSILKGRKFKVESARPQKRQAEEEDVTPSDKPSPTKKSKKQKAEENVLDGYELPSGRKVKRGWTESSGDKTERRKKEKRSRDKQEKKAKTQLKSKYTEKPECLFRTKVPPNKSATADEKIKKQSKKKNKAAPEAVVHEFSQTMTHPTFLRADDSGKAVTVSYEQDKGWVDESGNLMEPASERVRKDQHRPGQVAGHKEKAKKVNTESTKIKSNSNSTEPKETESTESEDWTSSSGSSSESELTDSETEDSASSTSSEVSEAFGSAKEPQQNATSEPEFRAESGASPKGKLTEAALQQVSTEVHPLEALFKISADQQKPDMEPPTQFSFFGQGNTDSEEEDAAPSNTAPLTPFTKRDLQDRGLRSAAPTPDTSQVSKIINWNTPDPLKNPDEEDYSLAYSPVLKPGVGPAKEESDFAKWFWENRGDNNRAWKKRRRDAAKEQRQRENRRKGMKGKS